MTSLDSLSSKTSSPPCSSPFFVGATPFSVARRDRVPSRLGSSASPWHCCKFAPAATMSVVITDSDIVGESVESQLLRFYKKFNPAKATHSHVAKCLSMWQGKQAKLFKNLEKKYDATGFFRSSKRSNVGDNVPHAVATPEEIVIGGAAAAVVEVQADDYDGTVGGNAKSSATAARKTKSARAARRKAAASHLKVADHPKGTLRESLTQFYKVYNRFKLDNIPKILLKIGSQKDQIYDLFVNLQKMYSRVPAWTHWEWAEARCVSVWCSVLLTCHLCCCFCRLLLRWWSGWRLWLWLVSVTFGVVVSPMLAHSRCKINMLLWLFVVASKGITAFVVRQSCATCSVGRRRCWPR